MSSILYYSNFCPNSKELIKGLSKSSIKDDIHFINIDQRTTKPDGTTHIILQNGQEILLPPTVNKVPALLLLNRGNKVIFGEEIQEFLRPKQIELETSATQNNGEPLAFALGGDNYGNSGFGVASDTYSFLDQNPEDLSAKGDGGMRQTWHYATLNDNVAIETPPDTYSPDKVEDSSYKNFTETRDNEIRQQNPQPQMQQQMQ
tara:strand:- start:477 stop:1085 length:609 start_codon:yes stop_codon:yes gene_type:complete